MKLLEEFKKPFNLITLSLALASIILSVLFYINSLKNKDLSYQINEPTSIVYDSKNSSSKIKLFEKDSILITENVYLLTGTLWNSGDLPIYINDVRKDIEFNINEKNRILDFKINKQKDSEIAKFTLKYSGENSLRVNWDYFDPNYGFNFQIIYIGEENPEFEIEGKILDISSINKVKQLESTSRIYTIGITIAYGLMILMIIYLSYLRKKRSGKYQKIYLFMLIPVVVIFIYLLISKILIPTELPI
jgi:hypothetical protein